MTLQVVIKYDVNKGDDLTHWADNSCDAFSMVAGRDFSVTEEHDRRVVSCINGPAIVIRNALGEVKFRKHTQIEVCK